MPESLPPLLAAFKSIHSLPVSLGALVLGIALLVAGRHLFWLFVGAVGFVVALELVSPWVGNDRPAVALIVSGVAGIAGAALAIFVQKVAIGLAGTVAGAYYLHRLLEATSMHDPRYGWVSALIGAALGALLLVFLFKWALMFFSSVVGAHVIIKQAVGELHIGLEMAGALFIILVVAGMLAQSRQGRQRVSEE